MYNGFREDLADAGLMPVKAVDLRTNTICREGTEGVETIDIIAPEANDYVINKKRFSAFFGTELDIILRGLKADTTIITGCVTSGCIRMTAYDAFQRDYRVVIPEECVGDQTPALHQQTLYIMNIVVADVMPVNQVISHIETLPQSGT